MYANLNNSTIHLCTTNILGYFFIFADSFIMFSARRKETILDIRSTGRGLSRGKWMDPFVPLNAESSSLNASMPDGMG